jgi:hypothetical protein
MKFKSWLAEITLLLERMSRLRHTDNDRVDPTGSQMLIYDWLSSNAAGGGRGSTNPAPAPTG